MTNWKALIEKEMIEQNDSFSNLIECTLTEQELLIEFDKGYGDTEGKPFTLWTKTRVYFPVTYDGAEWVGSVSRDPDGKATEHFGGG